MLTIEKESICKVWSIDNSGVLNLLGVTSRTQKVFPVEKLKGNSLKKMWLTFAIEELTISDILKYVKFQWESNRMFTLILGKNAGKKSFSF